MHIDGFPIKQSHLILPLYLASVVSKLPPLNAVLLKENVEHSLALLAFLPSIATVVPRQTYIAMSALRSLILTFRIISGLQSQPLRVFWCMYESGIGDVDAHCKDKTHSTQT